MPGGLFCPVGEDIILPQSFAMAHLIHRFAVPLPPLGKALIVDFRLFGFGGMLRYTVGRGLAPAAKIEKQASFLLRFC